MGIFEDMEREASEKEAPKALEAMAVTIERLMSRNEKCLCNLVEQKKKLTIFHGARPPNISVSKYLERIYKYTNCSPSCFVVGLVYIDRLFHKQPNIPVISLNVHRLLVTSIMVATKLLEDVHYNNAFYAKVGGISTAKLNRLELDFVFRLDFKFQVTRKTFESYCTHLERESLRAGQQIERATSNLGFYANHQEVSDTEKNLEDAQKRLLFFLDHNGSSVAAALSRNSSNPPSR